MSVFHAVAWDIDGTLVDSEGLHQRSLIETGADFGVDLSDLRDEAFRGIHMRDVWTALKPRFPHTVDRKGGSRRLSASMSPTRRRSQPSPARSRRSTRSRRRASPRRACRTQAARSSTQISTRSASAGRWRSRSVSTTCPPASRIRNRIGKRPGASRFRLLRLSRSKTAAPGARSARAAGLHVIGYAPDGNALVGCDRSIVKLTEVLALFGD